MEDQYILIADCGIRMPALYQRGTYAVFFVTYMRKVLGKIAPVILGTKSPVDVKVSLRDTIANPIVPHTHSFGMFYFTESLAMPAAHLLSI